LNHQLQPFKNMP